MKNKNICNSLNNMMQSETETKREAVTLILDYFEVCKVKHDKFETAAHLWNFSLYKLNLILNRIITRTERDYKIIFKNI
jgi:hypothetical protein